MRHNQRLLSIALLVLVAYHPLIWALPQVTDDTPADKSKFSIFNPTPNSLMRDFATDRPDKTESAYTVDAGHFQIETDLITYAMDSEKGSTNIVSTFNLMNLKVGLTSWADLQLVTESLVEDRTRQAGVTEAKRGFGDIYLRLKMNLFGNDSGDVAMAIMPVLKIPTNGANLGNKDLEGGVLLPLTIQLPNKWGAGTMIQYNRIKDEAGDGYHSQFISSLSLSHQIINETSGFFEIYSESSTEMNASWISTFDVGITHMVTPNLQLDSGAYIGLTEAADDINPFLGVSYRY